MGRNREEPSAEVAHVPSLREMAQELQKRLLDDIFRILVVCSRTVANRYTAAPCCSNRSWAACDASMGVSITLYNGLAARL